MPYKSNTRKIFAAFLLVCLFCGPASAGTVTGQIFLGSSGTALKDGNLTFTASQFAIQSGTGLIVNAPITCATDASGNVVGIHKPTPAPTVTPNTASGTLASGTYFTKIVLLDGTGHTLPSDETTTVLSSTGSLIVNPPASVGHATQWAVYISTSSGAETLQSTLTGFAANYTQSSALTAGSALPVSNTTTCTFPFTDELVPTGTNYSVNLTSSAGAQYAGFPTKAQFYGGANGSVNVSSGFPAASNFILYPTPIVSSPANSSTQSINGSVSLNGFNLLGLGAVVSNSANPAGSGLVELANTDSGDCWRNAALSADVCLKESGAVSGVIPADTLNLLDFGGVEAKQVNTPIIQQPAATTWTLKDNSGGTRYSIPSNGTSQATLNNTNLTASSTFTSGTINGGITKTGTGFQHIRTGVSTCTTGAAVGANCNTTVTLNTTMADTNYTVSCNLSVSFVSGVPTLTAISAKTTTNFNVTIAALTATAAQAGGIDCIVVHD